MTQEQSEIRPPRHRLPVRAGMIAALAIVTVLSACTSTDPADEASRPSQSAAGSTVSSIVTSPVVTPQAEQAGAAGSSVRSSAGSPAASAPESSAGSPADHAVGVIPAAAAAIMAKPAYRAARWTYQVSDEKTGTVLLANEPDKLAFTGSTAKTFTVGAAYEVLGADSRLTTPVYAVGDRKAGVLHGNLVLVGSGDLTLGGRNADADRADSSYTATAIDHVYGDIAPIAVKPPGDPLAGLNKLAAQVAHAGISRVAGDVLIDDRLWQPYAGQGGLVTPIFVNDNLLDITVTPTTQGKPATALASPRTSAFQVVSSVQTEAGSEVALHVSADPKNPHRLLLTGTIGADAGPRLTVYRITDPAAWARTLFIEALQRAGVAVSAPAQGPDTAKDLPTAAYRSDQRVAALKSPPLSAFGSLILMTSYNSGANALLCLLAVHQGKTDCDAGLSPIRTVRAKAGLDSNQVILVDGQGADPASVTPEQMVNWLRWTQTRPWRATFNAGFPVLGVSGSLAANGIDSPAKGKVAAKTGTSAHVDPATGRTLFNVQALAGLITTDDGRTLAFHLSMSGGVYPDVQTGLVQAGDDVAAVAAAFQQALSK